MCPEALGFRNDLTGILLINQPPPRYIHPSVCPSVHASTYPSIYPSSLTASPALWWWAFLTSSSHWKCSRSIFVLHKKHLHKWGRRTLRRHPVRKPLPNFTCHGRHRCGVFLQLRRRKKQAQNLDFLSQCRMCSEGSVKSLFSCNKRNRSLSVSPGSGAC